MSVPGGQRRVSLAGHQPGGAVISVPVPLVVHRDDVHQHDVFRVLVHSGERDPDGGKHPPDDHRAKYYYYYHYYYYDMLIMPIKSLFIMCHLVFIIESNQY